MLQVVAWDDVACLYRTLGESRITVVPHVSPVSRVSIRAEDLAEVERILWRWGGMVPVELWNALEGSLLSLTAGAAGCCHRSRRGGAEPEDRWTPLSMSSSAPPLPRTEPGAVDLLLPPNPAAMAVQALLPSSSSGGRLGMS
jgi:hypothetical protein